MNESNTEKREKERYIQGATRKVKKKRKKNTVMRNIIVCILFFLFCGQCLGLGYLGYRLYKMEKRSITLENEIKELETYISENIDVESINVEKRKLLDVLSPVKTISHRGYNYVAPENTVPAFIMSKQMGFNAVESDVCFTKDNVPVMSHDYSIERTSNGTGDIRDMTFEELREFDFGIRKSEEYAGTKIASFEEYISTCKRLGLEAYVHIKYESEADWSPERMNILVEIVKRYDMQEYVTWLDYKPEPLDVIAEAIPEGRFALLIFDDVYNYYVELAQTFMEMHPDAELVFAASSEYTTDSNIQKIMDSGISLEVFCIDDEEQMTNLHPYVSGVISNHLSASEVLYNDIAGIAK